jgi:hypothetical protein
MKQVPVWLRKLNTIVQNSEKKSANTKMHISVNQIVVLAGEIG